MLRELNEAEMMMVSGGNSPNENPERNPMLPPEIPLQGSSTTYTPDPVAAAISSAMDSENCTPNAAQEAGFAGYGDMAAWLNGYGHTRFSDGSAGALIAGVIQDINNPGCSDTPTHPSQNP